MLFVGCKENKEPKDVVKKNPTEAIKESTTAKDSITAKAHALLQGEWMNIDDNASTILFDGNQSYNRYQGIGNEAEIFFTLGNSCKNRATPTGTVPTDVFISTSGDSQECYYILKLDNENLVLNYLNGGVSLRFQKVKK